MRGALIYERGNIERNRRYIELFTAAAARRGDSLLLLCTDAISFGFQNRQPFFLWNGSACPLDFAVMRCIRLLLSVHLEGMGIPVFNPAKVSRICNDKRETARLFYQKKLPFVDTAFASSSCMTHPFSYPVVVKAADGCGGRQVFLCRSAEEYASAIARIAPSAAVVQPFVETGGRDVRLYMLGGRFRIGMERCSDSGDFRSNFGLNGHARPCAPDAALIALAERAIDGLSAALVGVDFLFDRQGHVFLNEIEDAVGTRMLYQYTDIDIVDEYMALIHNTVIKK